MDSLSEEGRGLVKRLGMDDSILVFETLSHDGYDADGPLSDLWNLYIIRLGAGTAEAYHRENWFHGTPEPYERIGSLSLDILLTRLAPDEKERLTEYQKNKKSAT